MINKEQVKHIAKLVRLRLSEEEVEKYQKQLGEILDYVSQLEKTKTKSVKPFFRTNLQNVFRPDQAEQKNIEQTENLIKQSPQREKGLIKTRGIFYDPQ